MTEIPRPTTPGVHTIRLKEGERMLRLEHNDPFRTHYYTGPLQVRVTVYADGGTVTVWGWDND